MSWLNLQKGTLSCKIILLIFNCLLFHHFVQEVNEIWSPWWAIINLLTYQILLASCAKRAKYQAISVWSKLFCRIWSIRTPQWRQLKFPFFLTVKHVISLSHTHVQTTLVVTLNVSLFFVLLTTCIPGF